MIINKDKYLFVSEPDKAYENDKLGSCIIKMPKNDIIGFDAIEKCKREKEKVLNYYSFCPTIERIINYNNEYNKYFGLKYKNINTKQ